MHYPKKVRQPAGRSNEVRTSDPSPGSRGECGFVPVSRQRDWLWVAEAAKLERHEGCLKIIAPVIASRIKVDTRLA
jgi:hypothetical protein